MTCFTGSKNLFVRCAVKKQLTSMRPGTMFSRYCAGSRPPTKQRCHPRIHRTGIIPGICIGVVWKQRCSLPVRSIMVGKWKERTLYSSGHHCLWLLQVYSKVLHCSSRNCLALTCTDCRCINCQKTITQDRSACLVMMMKVTAIFRHDQ